MKLYLDVQSPAVKEAAVTASIYGLESHGLSRLRRVYWNLPTPALYEEIAHRSEGRISNQGPVLVDTGKHTARAAGDKFVVREQSTEDHIWWGQYNRPYNPENFSMLHSRLQGYLQGRDVFVQDCFAGADPEYRLPIRIITEKAWHALFARNMFLRAPNQDTLKKHIPDFTIIAVPSFKASPLIDSTRTETFIIINFREKLALIGGSDYGGEIKKTIFTVLNFLLPLEGVLSMHCSANVGMDGDVAIFFGLSGTGKTTLSADPERKLIGDLRSSPVRAVSGPFSRTWSWTRSPAVSISMTTR
jgi:phosphoenolpyruvate carboxykinase (ATP)